MFWEFCLVTKDNKYISRHGWLFPSCAQTFVTKLKGQGQENWDHPFLRHSNAQNLQIMLLIFLQRHRTRGGLKRDSLTRMPRQSGFLYRNILPQIPAHLGRCWITNPGRARAFSNKFPGWPGSRVERFCTFWKPTDFCRSGDFLGVQCRKIGNFGHARLSFNFFGPKNRQLFIDLVKGKFVFIVFLHF